MELLISSLEKTPPLTGHVLKEQSENPAISHTETELLWADVEEGREIITQFCSLINLINSNIHTH